MAVGKLIDRMLGMPHVAATRWPPVTLSEHGRQFEVILAPNLPDDAYQQLFLLDLSLLPAGVLTWDRRSRAWRHA